MDKMNKLKRPKAKSEDRTPGRAKQKGTGGKSTNRPQRETQGAGTTRRAMKDTAANAAPRAGQAGKRDKD
jgi:hypothetical protein